MEDFSSFPLEDQGREIGLACVLTSRFGSLRQITLLAGVFLGLLTATELCAQTLQGRVLDPEAGTPVQGAMVVGKGADGQVVARALTRPDGTFVLSTERSVGLQLRVERIGYGSTVHRVDDVDSSDPVVIRVSSSPIALEEVGVVGDNLCGAEFVSTNQVYGIWLEVRKALEITRLSQAEGVLAFNVERIVRTLDPDDLEERDRTVEQRRLSGSKPYLSLTATEMTERGWAEAAEDGAVLFHAPDAAALLTEAFTEQHCFQGEIADGQMVLRFTPHPSRASIPEIEGELLLDGDTHELTTLRFRYTSIPLPAIAEGRAEGQVRFTAAPNGLRIVRDWWIRIPVLSLRPRWIEFRRAAWYRIETMREEGGRVLSIHTGSDVIELSSITSQIPAVVHGRVEDAESGDPVGGALVLSADSLSAVLADSLGVFALPLEPDRPYVVVAEQFGYEPTVFELSEDATARISILQLQPSPISVEGITVIGESAMTNLADRMEERRGGYPAAVRVMNRDQISRAGAGSAFDLVLRGMPGLRDCETGSYPNPGSIYLCRRSRIPTLRQGSISVDQLLVCIDDIASFAPVPDLESIPIEQVAFAEFYGPSPFGTSNRQLGSGANVSATRLTPTVGQARVYTRRWMLSNAGRPRSLFPVQFGC